MVRHAVPAVRSISTPKLLRKSERRYYKITGSDDPESRQAFTNLSTNTPYFSGTDQAQELPDPA